MYPKIVITMSISVRTPQRKTANTPGLGRGNCLLFKAAIAPSEYVHTGILKFIVDDMDFDCFNHKRIIEEMSKQMRFIQIQCLNPCYLKKICKT